jgi:Tol biopolymer transport system component
MRIDRGVPRRVTANGDPEWGAWSPDGRRLLYIANQETDRGAVWIIDEDGIGAHRLLAVGRIGGDIYDAAWSPDGRWIAIEACRCPAGASALHPHLYIVHPDGGGLRLLASDANRFAWSPEGSQLVYAEPSSDDPPASEEIWVADVANGRRTLLTRRTRFVASIAWSADGSRIAYADADYGVDWGGVTYSDVAVRTLGASGGLPRVVGRVGFSRGIDIAWLAPARALLYSGEDCSDTGIHIASTNRPLDESPGPGAVIAAHGCLASLSPDGTHILFVEEQDYEGALFLATIRGRRSVTRVTQRQGDTGASLSRTADRPRQRKRASGSSGYGPA